MIQHRRLAFLALLLVLVMGSFWIRPAYAADAAGTPTATAVESRNPFALVLDNLDLVFFTIGALSITGLALIIHGFMKNRREVYMPVGTVNRMRAMIESRAIEELVGFTASDPSFIAQAFQPAVRRYPDFEQMRESLETALSEKTAESFRRIEYLNIIGNLGPLLGLLGTVLGMIAAFQAMNLAGGRADPAQLAGGISKALAHTMLGLLLAVPCLAAFGVLRTQVDRLTNQTAILAEELLLSLKPDIRPVTPTMPPPPVIRHHPAVPAQAQM